MKDRTFYVFSSNAHPFEPNGGYSPFAVYCLLEHGGNYEGAAGELRAQGYGHEIEAADVDLSGLLGGETKAEVRDPGLIPESLFHVPGLISRVMDFSLASAPYPNAGLAFCGALALQSFLTGRKVCTPGDLRTNLYILALASSGTGKDFPRKVNARILFDIGLVDCMLVHDKRLGGWRR